MDMTINLPPPAAIRQRITDCELELRALRRLLRTAQDAADAADARRRREVVRVAALAPAQAGVE
jgi:hypothetical protein